MITTQKYNQGKHRLASASAVIVHRRAHMRPAYARELLVKQGKYI